MTVRSTERHRRSEQQSLVTVHSDHFLATHKLTLMRDPECATYQFRNLARELGTFLAYEIMREFSTLHKDALDKQILVVPILRAGLVLADGALEAMPAAHVGHLSFRRLKDAKFSVAEHMIILPYPMDRLVIIFDAVIGTGNTACAAINVLKEEGALGENIRFGTILISPQGIEKLNGMHPDVIVHTISIEEDLDEKNHIVPGFGDASDRLFGIKNPLNEA